MEITLKSDLQQKKVHALEDMIEKLEKECDYHKGECEYLKTASDRQAALIGVLQEKIIQMEEYQEKKNKLNRIRFQELKQLRKENAKLRDAAQAALHFTKAVDDGELTGALFESLLIYLSRLNLEE